MKILTLDVENTMYKHQRVRDEEGRYNPRDRVGQAFSLPQFLAMVGIKWMDNDKGEGLKWQVDEPLFSFNRTYLQTKIDQSDLVVGFNIKHDLHWLRRVGINLSNIVIWDCQLAEFLLEAQRNPYPSLNKTCEKYGFPLKLDIIEEEYWSKGIDTDEIPIDVLWEYLQGDLDRTERIFLKQVKRFGQEWMIK